MAETKPEYYKTNCSIRGSTHSIFIQSRSRSETDSTIFYIHAPESFTCELKDAIYFHVAKQIKEGELKPMFPFEETANHKASSHAVSVIPVFKLESGAKSCSLYCPHLSCRQIAECLQRFFYHGDLDVKWTIREDKNESKQKQQNQ